MLAVQADVNAGADNKAAVEHVVKQAVEEFGRIDVLINNAQASASGVTLADHTTEQFDLAILFRTLCNILLYAGMLSIFEGNTGIRNQLCIRSRPFSVITDSVRMQQRRKVSED